MVYRIYVEKKPGFDGEAQGLLHELVELVGIANLKGLRLLNRYDVEGIDRDLFDQAIPTVFSEPPVDVTYDELPAAQTVFAVEYLPGAGLMDDPTGIIDPLSTTIREGAHWYDIGILRLIYAGVKSSIFPCLIFMGVGAMTDFGREPLHCAR